jgi:hypothetical protein
MKAFIPEIKFSIAWNERCSQGGAFKDSFYMHA